MTAIKKIAKMVLPRRVRRWLRWQQARRAGVIKTSGSIPENVCVIDISDNCTVARIRHGFNGSVVEREQSPAVSLFRDPAFDYLELARDLHTVNFRGVSLDWIHKSGVWPPTLDSYIMVAALVDAWPGDNQRIWEVGCGSGIIGLHLLRLASCRDALFTDIDPRAIEHTTQNARKMGLTNLSLRVESFPPASPTDEPFDLLVCNPPYFPPGFEADSKRFRQSSDDLSLTRALFEQGLQHAKRVVVGYSSVLLEEVEGYVSELRSASAEWEVLCKVPLPMTVTLADPARASGGGISRDNARDPRFPLWHDFYVGELRRPGVETKQSAGRMAGSA